VAEQVKAKVGIGNRGHWKFKIDFGANDLDGDSAELVFADQCV
jgi:hypothetical protein